MLYILPLPDFTLAEIENSSKHLVVSHCGLDLCFSDTNGKQYFMCLLPSCVSSFFEVSVQIFY